MIKNLKYINIEYTEKDLEYIDEVCNVIDKKSEDIVNFFELKEFNDKVNVKLFNELEDFRIFYKETYHIEPKDYVCGFSKDNNVYTLSLNEYKKCLSHEESNIEDLERLILHEFTHSVHSKRQSNMNIKWISEGAATYLSGQHKDKKVITCNYNELLEGTFYHNYKLMFEYVLSTYGKDYILKLIDDEELLKKESKRLFEEALMKYNIKVHDLETERLILKIPTMKEQYDLWNILKNENVNRLYMPIPSRFEDYYKAKTDSEEDRKIRIEQRKLFQEKLQDWDKQKVFYQKKIDNLDNNSSMFSWSIFLKTGEIIGQISVQPNSNYEDNPKIRDIGWFIDPKYQRKGYAYEAASKVLEYMFNEAKIDEISTGAAQDNPASWGLMEKLGFVRTGEKMSTYIDEEGYLLKGYSYDLTKEMYLEKDKVVFDSEHINYIKMNSKYIDDYLNMYNNKEMQMVLFGKEKEFSKEQIENWITKVLNDNSNTFTMIEKETNDFIGIIEIMNIKDNNGELAISITPNKQNKHYGTEAMNAIIEYGYKNVGLRSINVNVHKSNPRAIHLYENTGFIQDKEKDESIHMKHNR